MPTSAPNQSRRQWAITSAVGIAALGLGGYVAWQRLQPGPATSDAVSELFNTPLSRPDATQGSLAQLRGKPLLVNFWGTWCPPCVKEMPVFDAFYRSTDWPKEMQLVGLAVDKIENVVQFTPKVAISYPIFIGGFAALELSRKLGNNKKILPHTLLISAQGTILKNTIGELDEAKLRDFVQI